MTAVACSNSKINKCEVCSAKDAQYTCPKCEVRTCSLPCVNIHKKELDCDGVRNKVGFKAISAMNNLDLLSDYRLLEEVTRSVENYARDKSKTYSRYNKDLPIQLFKLRAAANRRNVCLHFLPQNFTRHASNTTFLDWKTQIISWCIEWIFPQADNLKCIDKRLNETERLGVQVDRYLKGEAGDPLLNSRLQWYQAAGIKGVRLLLKAEQISKSHSYYYALDPSQTLKDCLQGKTIIEYPTIYVILNEHENNYDILDSDEEIEKDDAILEGRGVKRQKFDNGKNYKSSHSKNLLFNDSEDSDLEETRSVPGFHSELKK